MYQTNQQPRRERRGIKVSARIKRNRRKSGGVRPFEPQRGSIPVEQLRFFCGNIKQASDALALRFVGVSALAETR